MGEHVCNRNSAWPTGHPLPPENPALLQGPEVGEVLIYRDPRSDFQRNVVSKVLQRSYVWSPGECHHKGGYRHYDWTVIQDGPNERNGMVVDDDKLHPIPLGSIVAPADPETGRVSIAQRLSTAIDLLVGIRDETVHSVNEATVEHLVEVLRRVQEGEL